LGNLDKLKIIYEPAKIYIL
jgi:hypothetical protein